MSRAETTATTKYRVQVHLGELVTHESLFSSGKLANDYYNNLVLPGEIKLQIRLAGKSRFDTIRSRKLAT